MQIRRTEVTSSRTTQRTSVTARRDLLEDLVAVAEVVVLCGTLMTLADGSQKKIEEIRVGEKLLGLFDTINEVKVILEL